MTHYVEIRGTERPFERVVVRSRRHYLAGENRWAYVEPINPDLQELDPDRGVQVAYFFAVPGRISSVRVFHPLARWWKILQEGEFWTSRWGAFTVVYVPLAAGDGPPYFDPSGLGIRDNRSTAVRSPEAAWVARPAPARPVRDS